MFCVSVSYIEKACKTVYTLLWGYVGLVWYGVVTSYPASGYRLQVSGEFGVTGSYGYYWNSAVSGVNAYIPHFSASLAVSPTFSAERARGLSVRCVQNLQSDLCVALKGSSLL